MELEVLRKDMVAAMKAKDKDRIQNDIEHGSQHDGLHTQAGKALGIQLAVHARG